MSFPSLPPGVQTPATITIAPNESEAVVTLAASDAADLGAWKLVADVQIARPARGGRDPLLVGMNGLGTETDQPGGRHRHQNLEGLPHVASELTPIKLTEPPIKGKFAPAAGEQGKTVTAVCKLEAGAIPAGTFTARLSGLPPRTKAEPVVVKSDAQEIEFLVTVDATTPPGVNESLVCELTGTLDGQKVVYRIGRTGTLRVDVPGGVKTDASCKPLNPLDVLRLEQKKP